MSERPEFLAWRCWCTETVHLRHHTRTPPAIVAGRVGCGLGWSPWLRRRQTASIFLDLAGLRLAGGGRRTVRDRVCPPHNEAQHHRHSKIRSSAVRRRQRTTTHLLYSIFTTYIYMCSKLSLAFQSKPQITNCRRPVMEFLLRGFLFSTLFPR